MIRNGHQATKERDTTMKRTASTLAGLVVVAAILTGCTSTPEPTFTSGTPTPTPTSAGPTTYDPPADETERHRPHGHVDHLAGLAAAGHPPAIAPPAGDDDADDDAQRVRADRDGPEVPHALGGARNAREDHARHPTDRCTGASGGAAPT